MVGWVTWVAEGAGRSGAVTPGTGVRMSRGSRWCGHLDPTWLAGTEDIAEASKGLVKFFDLTDPVFMGMYDWAISIEVAEHLPPFLEPAIW